jgi:hypothetical protein
LNLPDEVTAYEPLAQYLLYLAKMQLGLPADELLASAGDLFRQAGNVALESPDQSIALGQQASEQVAAGKKLREQLELFAQQGLPEVMAILGRYNIQDVPLPSRAAYSIPVESQHVEAEQVGEVTPQLAAPVEGPNRNQDASNKREKITREERRYLFADKESKMARVHWQLVDTEAPQEVDKVYHALNEVFDDEIADSDLNRGEKLSKLRQEYSVMTNKSNTTLQSKLVAGIREIEKAFGEFKLPLTKEQLQIFAKSPRTMDFYSRLGKVDGFKDEADKEKLLRKLGIWTIYQEVQKQEGLIVSTTERNKPLSISPDLVHFMGHIVAEELMEQAVTTNPRDAANLFRIMTEKGSVSEEVLQNKDTINKKIQQFFNQFKALSEVDQQTFLQTVDKDTQVIIALYMQSR